MKKSKLKDIDIEISEAKVKEIPSSDAKLMEVLGAIDWKLWEILQIMQSWDKEQELDEDVNGK
jgi:hypothetical protein